MKKLTTIIVEDMKDQAIFLQKVLAKNCDNVEVLATCSTAEKAQKRIRELKPDFIFLDIQLGNSSGFDLLHDLGDMRFKVVIVTSFEDYLLEALRASATDFLVKPYTEKQLRESVQRVDAALQTEAPRLVGEQLRRISDSVEAPFIVKSIIQLRNIEGIHLVPIPDIVYCKAESNQTDIILKDKSSIRVSQLLSEFEKKLGPFGIVRIHKSHLINLSEIERYKKSSGDVYMKHGGKVFSVPRERKEWFDDLFDSLFV